jgi:hypothetical protein
VYILATRGFDVRGACVLVAVGVSAGLGVGVGVSKGLAVGAFPPRVTRATAAHRLTQLCAIPCSFAAAQTPFVRTVASTACRFSSVWLRRFSFAISTSGRPGRGSGTSGVSAPIADGQMFAIR